MQQLQRRRVNPLDVASIGLVCVSKEACRKWRNLFTTLSERGDVDRHGVEPKEQIAPKASLLTHRLQIAMGGSDHPRIDRQLFARANTREPFCFEHAQQRHLGRLWKLPDLVEQDATAIRRFENALLLLARSRKSPFFVTKQRALDELRGNGAAVDTDERLVAPGAALVDRLGYNLFATTRFALEQDRNLRTGNPVDRAKDPFHGFAQHDSTAGLPAFRLNA